MQARFFKRRVQQASSGTGEGSSDQILLIARLFAYHHQSRTLGALAADALGGVAPQRTAAAPLNAPR